MKIKYIEEHSIADQIELKPGDDIVSINGNIIRDIIDYRFHISDEYVKVEVSRNRESFFIEVEKDIDDDLGVAFESIQYRCCGNKCIFCFVDQNPKNLRKNLYFKDEDFRLSFLHGNYVTMTNISKQDLQRIVEQRLSPIYISVHAIDPAVRKLMLGLKSDDHLLEKIKYLADRRIEIHVQIVLCPGINDGEFLNHTIFELEQFYPNVKSIAIVPVGLTRHRQHLFPLSPITPMIAKEVIRQMEQLADNYKKKYGSYFIYLADEFYLLASHEIPQAERYEHYYQYENGVGMMRHLIDEFAAQSTSFPAKLNHPQKFSIITAELAAKFFEKTIIPRLNSIGNLEADLRVVTNYFYGTSVKVTGLLTGSDIYKQLKDIPPVDLVLLPENCFNEGGLMLDDWTVDMLEKKLNQRIKIIGLNFVELFNEN